MISALIHSNDWYSQEKVRRMKGMKYESKHLELYGEDDDNEDDDSEYRHYLRRRRREKARRRELEQERAKTGNVPRNIYPYSDEETLSLYSETTVSWEARCNGGDDVRFCGMTL